MLIKMVDGKLMYDDIQSTETTMLDQIRIWETHEQGAKEMTKKIKQNLEETRSTLHVYKKQRADKEALIERNMCRLKQFETMYNIAVERNEIAVKDTRLDQLAKEKERKMRAEIKRLYENQAVYHNKIMAGLYKTETLDKLLHNAFDKDMRLKARMEKNLDRLRYALNRQDELKVSIRKKLSNVKTMHGEVFALEPKIKESFNRLQTSSAKVAELSAKVKEREDEIKRTQEERKRMIQRMEKAAVECGQKQKRSQKGPPTIKALEKIGPKKSPIECYKIKKPEIVKAFERFTELYAVKC